MIDWLFTNALAALALAAIAGVLIWTFRPAPAVRHALWLVVVLKLVSPTGLVVSLPLPVESPAIVREETKSVAPEYASNDIVVEEELFTVMVTPLPGQSPEEAAVAAMRVDAAPVGASSEPAASEYATDIATITPGPTFGERLQSVDYRPWLLGTWALGAAFIAWRQIRETLRFARFTRKSLPAGDYLIAEVAVVANRLGVRMPAVRVLTGLTSPVLWCLWKPILLWPAGLECRLKGDGRRAVLTHELAHLRRRDHWARRLEMVAAILHWWNPLFWIARKKMRADAELACDAWAAGQADRRVYAEALIEVCSFHPRRRPAPAVGVIGEGRRAMQERLTMIMRDRVPCRLAFGAKLVVALMAIAAVPAWTLGQGAPVAKPPVPAPSPSAADPQVQAIEEQIRALSAKLEAIKAAKKAESEKSAVEKLKAAQGELANKLKTLRFTGEADAALAKPVSGEGYKVLVAGQDGVKVIGPDGKEIKDAKVIIVDSKTGKVTGSGAVPVVRMVTGTATAPALEGKRVTVTGTGKDGQFAFTPAQGGNYAWTARALTGGSNAITLSRATYKLGKEQSAALGTLLSSIKASVMETKVDGDAITVTTTPEIQSTIGQIVRLMQGQTGGSTFEWKVTPSATVPAAPRAPAAPAPPATPAAPKAPTPAKPAASSTKPAEIELELFRALEATKKPVELDLKLDIERLKELQKLYDAAKAKFPDQKAKPAEKKPEGPAK
jgi:beta-lactamase regulating signal transducer with metallopeptidase domain